MSLSDYRREEQAHLEVRMTIDEFERQVLDPSGPFHSIFASHLLSEHSNENLSFLLAVEHFKSQY